LELKLTLRTHTPPVRKYCGGVVDDFLGYTQAFFHAPLSFCVPEIPMLATFGSTALLGSVIQCSTVPALIDVVKRYCHFTHLANRRGEASNELPGVERGTALPPSALTITWSDHMHPAKLRPDFYPDGKTAASDAIASALSPLARCV